MVVSEGAMFDLLKFLLATGQVNRADPMRGNFKTSHFPEKLEPKHIDHHQSNSSSFQCIKGVTKFWHKCFRCYAKEELHVNQSVKGNHTQQSLSIETAFTSKPFNILQMHTAYLPTNLVAYLLTVSVLDIAKGLELACHWFRPASSGDKKF